MVAIPALVAAYLAMDDVMPNALAQDDAFAQAVLVAYQALTHGGLNEALAVL